VTHLCCTDHSASLAVGAGLLSVAAPPRPTVPEAPRAASLRRRLLSVTAARRPTVPEALRALCIPKSTERADLKSTRMLQGRSRV